MKWHSDLKNDKFNENQNFWILKKLVLANPTKSIQRKNLEMAFRNDSDNYPDSVIPHSSAINRINELVLNESISENDSGKESKKHLPMMQYRITSIGMIELLRLCYEKGFQQEIFENLNKLSYIKFTLDNLLLDVFTKEQIYDALVNVCKNTIIEIDHDPFSDKFSDKSKFFRVVTGLELSHEKDKMIVYHISTKFIQNSFSYTIYKRIPIYGTLQKKKRVFIKSKSMIAISKIISCVLFHELILRCSSMNYVDKGYSKNGKFAVMEIIRRYPEIKKVYSKFLSQINNNMKFNMDSLDEIEKSITSKKPLIKFVDKI